MLRHLALLAVLLSATLTTSASPAIARERICRMPGPFIGTLSWPSGPQRISCQRAVRVALGYLDVPPRRTRGWWCFDPAGRAIATCRRGRTSITVTALTM
jgi:hypothetical protein